MSGVPYVFGNATTSIPLSQLDVNFATNATIGTTSVGLGNTTTTLVGLTNVSTTVVNTSNVSANTSLLLQTNGTTTAITIDTSQNVTFANGIIPNSTSGIVGVTNGSNANAGVVGEYVSSTISSGSSITLTTSGTVYNVTSISLTAGDWDVTGIVLYTSSNGTTTFSYIQSGSTSTSATLGGSGTYSSGSYGNALLGAIVDFSQPVPTIRYSLSSTTTIYLFARASWGVLTPSAYGTIRARRVR